MLNLFPEMAPSLRKERVLPVVDLRDPYRQDGPTIINFSGGRTSGYMLHEYLARGLAPETHVVFCNTGKEKAETYSFVEAVAERWDVKIHWLEFCLQTATFPVVPEGLAELEALIVDPGKSKSDWKEVGPRTANWDGQPFEDLIRQHQAIPNRTMRFCTSFLKLYPAEKFMRSQGYEHWTAAVGIRADEPRRVAKMRGRKPLTHEDLALPLAQAGVTEAQVLEFWKGQPFDLLLSPGGSNCDLCFLKGAGIRLREMLNAPKSAAWWLRMEQLTGNQWINPRGGRPSYQTLYQLAVNQQEMDFDTDALDPGFDCMCGD